jgi:hypothetical protein
MFLMAFQTYLNPLTRFQPINPATLKTLPTSLASAIKAWATVNVQDGAAVKSNIDATVTAAISAYKAAKISISETLATNLNNYLNNVSPGLTISYASNQWTMTVGANTVDVTNDAMQFYIQSATGIVGFAEWLGMIVQDALYTYAKV